MSDSYDFAGLDALGLGAFLDAEHVKAMLMGGAVGGGGILLTTTLLDKAWPQPHAASGSMFAPDYVPQGSPAGTAPTGTMNYRRAKSAVTALIGILGGRALYDRNRDASMAFVGGVAGLGLAELVATFVNDPASPMVRTSNLSGHLSLADLRALEMAVSTPMTSYQGMGNWGTPSQFNGPSVRTQQLSAPATSITELGSMAAYMPYLS